MWASVCMVSVCVSEVFSSPVLVPWLVEATRGRDLKKIGGHHAMLMVSHVKPPLLMLWSHQSPILLFDRCRS